MSETCEQNDYRLVRAVDGITFDSTTDARDMPPTPTFWRTVSRDKTKGCLGHEMLNTVGYRDPAID